MNDRFDEMAQAFKRELRGDEPWTTVCEPSEPFVAKWLRRVDAEARSEVREKWSYAVANVAGFNDEVPGYFPLETDVPLPHARRAAVIRIDHGRSACNGAWSRIQAWPQVRPNRVEGNTRAQNHGRVAEVRTGQ